MRIDEPILQTWCSVPRRWKRGAVLGKILAQLSKTLNHVLDIRTYNPKFQSVQKTISVHLTNGSVTIRVISYASKCYTPVPGPFLSGLTMYQNCVWRTKIVLPPWDTKGYPDCGWADKYCRHTLPTYRIPFTFSFQIQFSNYKEKETGRVNSSWINLWIM